MTPCAECGEQVHPLEIFPRGRCLPCHAAAPENQAMPTAADVAALWR